MPQRLVFVYNADGGRLAGLKDMFHKILSPSTYPCSLCAVTYGATSMQPQWRAQKNPLPAAYAVGEDGALTPLNGTPEMEAADLNGLMELVRQRL